MTEFMTGFFGINLGKPCSVRLNDLLGLGAEACGWLDTKKSLAYLALLAYHARQQLPEAAMFEKLTAAELDQLEKLLDRAVYNSQIGIGATIGTLIGDDEWDVKDGGTSFVTNDGIGGVCNTGDDIDLTLSYEALKWVWARVQGARGGKKRVLTTEQAKAMAAKRHAKA